MGCPPYCSHLPVDRHKDLSHQQDLGFAQHLGLISVTEILTGSTCQLQCKKFLCEDCIFNEMGFSLLTILFIVGYYVFAYSGSIEYISNDQADCTTCHRAPESEIN